MHLNYSNYVIYTIVLRNKTVQKIWMDIFDINLASS